MAELVIPEAKTEFIIPPSLVQEAKESGNRIIEKAADFDAILVLERSGPIAFAAISTLAKKKEVVLPKIITVKINREIFGAFQQTKNAQALFEEGPIDLLNNDTHRQLYLKWLNNNNDPLVKETVKKLKEKIEEGAEILIVDDCIYEGSTAIAAEQIALKAGAKKTETEIIFKNSGWLSIVLGNLSEEDFFASEEKQKKLKENLENAVRSSSG